MCGPGGGRERRGGPYHDQGEVRAEYGGWGQARSLYVYHAPTANLLFRSRLKCLIVAVLNNTGQQQPGVQLRA